MGRKIRVCIELNSFVYISGQETAVHLYANVVTFLGFLTLFSLIKYQFGQREVFADMYGLPYALSTSYYGV